MSVYEYDESKDKALSIMDGLCGGYSSKDHEKSILVFKMKDNKKFTFRRNEYTGFIVTVENGQSRHVVTFGYGGSGRNRIEGGISLKTETGRYRPQSVSIKKACERANVKYYHGLSIRQLCNAANEAVEEYQELLKMINGG